MEKLGTSLHRFESLKANSGLKCYVNDNLVATCVNSEKARPIYVKLADRIYPNSGSFPTNGFRMQAYDG